MASAIGRVGSCVMPVVSINLLYYNTYCPFLAYGVFGACAAVATYLLPYDTQGKYLDHEHESDVRYVELKTDGKFS